MSLKKSNFMLGGVVLVLLVIIVFIVEVNMTKNSSSLKDQEPTSMMDEVLKRILKVEELVKGMIVGNKQADKNKEDMQHDSVVNTPGVILNIPSSVGNDDKSKGSNNALPVVAALNTPPVISNNDNQKEEKKTTAGLPLALPSVINMRDRSKEDTNKQSSVDVHSIGNINTDNSSIIPLTSNQNALQDSTQLAYNASTTNANISSQNYSKESSITSYIGGNATMGDKQRGNKDNHNGNNTTAVLTDNPTDENNSQQHSSSLNSNNSISQLSADQQDKKSTTPEKKDNSHGFTQNTNVIIIPNDKEKNDQKLATEVVIVPLVPNDKKKESSLAKSKRKDNSPTKISIDKHANASAKRKSIRDNDEDNESIKPPTKQDMGNKDDDLNNLNALKELFQQIPPQLKVSPHQEPRKDDSVVVMASFSKTTTVKKPEKKKTTIQGQEKKEEKKKRAELEKDKKMWKNKDKLEDEKHGSGDDKEVDDDSVLQNSNANDRIGPRSFKMDMNTINGGNGSTDEETEVLNPIPTSNNRQIISPLDSAPIPYSPFQFQNRFDESDDKKAQGRPPIMSIENDDEEERYNYPHNNPLNLSNNDNDESDIGNKMNNPFNPMGMGKMNYEIF